MQSPAPSPCSFQPTHHKFPLALSEALGEWTVWDCSAKREFRGASRARACTVHSQATGTAILNSVWIAVTSGLCIHGSYTEGSPFMLQGYSKSTVTGAELGPMHCRQKIPAMLNSVQPPLQQSGLQHYVPHQLERGAKAAITCPEDHHASESLTETKHKSFSLQKATCPLTRKIPNNYRKYG